MAKKKKRKRKFVVKCKKHWYVYLFSVLFVVLIFIEPLFPFFLLAGLFLLYAIVLRKTEYVGITPSGKIIGHKGFINSKTLSTSIERVQDVSYENGLLGKLMGYHTIKIDTAGTGTSEYVYHYMQNAVAFSDYVNNRIAKLAKEKNTVQVVSPVRSGADEIMKYKDLYDSGVIDKEEFERVKKRVLDNL